MSHTAPLSQTHLGLFALNLFPALPGSALFSMVAGQWLLAGFVPWETLAGGREKPAVSPSPLCFGPFSPYFSASVSTLG